MLELKGGKENNLGDVGERRKEQNEGAREILEEKRKEKDDNVAKETSEDPGDGMKKDSILEEKWELSLGWDPKLMAGLAL